MAPPLKREAPAFRHGEDVTSKKTPVSAPFVDEEDEPVPSNGNAHRCYGGRFPGGVYDPSGYICDSCSEDVRKMRRVDGMRVGKKRDAERCPRCGNVIDPSKKNSARCYAQDPGPSPALAESTKTPGRLHRSRRHIEGCENCGDPGAYDQHIVWGEGARQFRYVCAHVRPNEDGSCVRCGADGLHDDQMECLAALRKETEENCDRYLQEKTLREKAEAREKTLRAQIDSARVVRERCGVCREFMYSIEWPDGSLTGECPNGVENPYQSRAAPKGGGRARISLKSATTNNHKRPVKHGRRTKEPSK